MRKHLRLLVLLGLLIAAAWLTWCRPDRGTSIADGSRVAGAAEAVNLAQGWTHEMQARAWFTGFGSRLVPYDWFLALEQAGTEQPFRDATHLDGLGFLTQAATADNPDGLPVGVVRSVDGDSAAWVGFGCAACHTGELRYGEHAIRVAGGAGMIDIQRFEDALVAALRETQRDAARRDRFIQRLGLDEAAAARVPAELERITAALARRVELNRTVVGYGPGRMDAFGQIFNAVGVEVLGVEANRAAPDAPVSIPVLWSTPRLDRVQWNGSSPNDAIASLIQNVTTAIAVHGTVDAGDAGGPGYASSADISALGRIQRWNGALRAPAWPEALLGALDRGQAARGRALFDAHCAACHRPPGGADEPLQAVLVPLGEVGTDALAATNFVREGATGPLEGRRQLVYGGATFGTRARLIDLVVHMAVGATAHHPFEAIVASVRGRQPVDAVAAEPDSMVYKARPLDGIWASAPYLHNGSVPTLADLLLPEAQRPAMFRVGSGRFDPRRVGLDDAATEGVLFDVTVRGNGNAGHRYGTELPEVARRDLLEFLKTL